MEKQNKITETAVATQVADKIDENIDENMERSASGANEVSEMSACMSAYNSHLKRDKVYKYERNGKTISVRRKWTNFGDKQLKQEALAEYFANNADIDRTKSIQTLFQEYNNNHELKISYSMFYKKYAEHFGPRRG